MYGLDNNAIAEIELEVCYSECNCGILGFYYNRFDIGIGSYYDLKSGVLWNGDYRVSRTDG
jgi:hypothetical protein